jgi:hypothetical protein
MRKLKIVEKSSIILVTLFCLYLQLIIGCKGVTNEFLKFSAMGDVPRSAVEDSILQSQIEQHNAQSDSEFMVHLGDIKSGSTPCDEEVYDKVANYLKKLRIPTYIVPGDNEWNDCTDPGKAWILWEKNFLGFENHWKDVPNIERQWMRTENFSFNLKGVLFVGINLVGGRIHDPDEWSLRHQQNIDWIKEMFAEYKEDVRAAVILAQANPKDKHEDFMTQFRVLGKGFGKPILFLHGDGHVWQHDAPWLESNIVRVQVDKGGIAPPLQVTITLDETDIFRFERKPFQ